MHPPPHTHTIKYQWGKLQLYCTANSSGRLWAETCRCSASGRGSDCGLFAVAFATALCSGIDPFTCSFKQTEMRSHLLTCFESHQLSTFPAPDRPRRLAHCRVLSTKRVPVYCVCRLPWNKYDKKRGPLVKCHSCKLWFHQFCLNIDNDIIVNKSAQFYCDFCHFDYDIHT